MKFALEQLGHSLVPVIVGVNILPELEGSSKWYLKFEYLELVVENRVELLENLECRCLVVGWESNERDV